ncbi:MAG TPA: biotin-dependent carboxyltransferase family protein [Gemmatimonadaceae bacterium]|nr:biotin-dependent carboxyltransferase family protein [Gemmatimonadaceae bacterium]
MIVVDQAPPYLTVQDAGRVGYRSSGVPPAGAMDQWSLAMANVYAGNQRNAAALEWAVGGGALRFEHETIIGLAGAEVDAAIGDRPVQSPGSFVVRSGEVLKVRAITARRFLYLALHGGIECPVVLGSRSTYLPASFGGIEGRRLTNGDVLSSGALALPQRHSVDGGLQESAGEPDYNATTVRVIPRSADAADQRHSGARDPDSELFARFVEQQYTVTAASDRMGYRLESAQPLAGARASITSEPVCAGTIQLTPSGQPIVLMADAPTIGGYRIVGTVISCDLPVVAQCVPGRTLRFERVSVEKAHALLEQSERALLRLLRAASAPAEY